VEIRGNLIVNFARIIEEVNVINIGINIKLVCWFGVRATKYANITNIPPT
jgi:hypothetical protein